jgi:emp24/gp25L/p24 family/GOLD
MYLIGYNVEHLDPINVKIAQLREALESVTSEQKYLKAREARHRHSKPFHILPKMRTIGKSKLH